jgi:2-dehydro-3-deoxygluconokinase
VLAGAGWFHVTGITPAVSEAAASRDRGRAHRTRHGHHGLVRSEFPEESLEVGQAASDVMPELVQLSDILIANEEDIQMALGLHADLTCTPAPSIGASYRG